MQKTTSCLTNSELQEKSQVNDALFVHISGFLGAAKSKEGALKLAVDSLNGNYTD